MPPIDSEVRVELIAAGDLPPLPLYKSWDEVAFDTAPPDEVAADAAAAAATAAADGPPIGITVTWLLMLVGVQFSLRFGCEKNIIEISIFAAK